MLGPRPRELGDQPAARALVSRFAPQGPDRPGCDAESEQQGRQLPARQLMRLPLVPGAAPARPKRILLEQSGDQHPLRNPVEAAKREKMLGLRRPDLSAIL